MSFWTLNMVRIREAIMKLNWGAINPKDKDDQELRNSLQAREFKSLGEKLFRLAEVCHEYNVHAVPRPPYLDY